MCSVVTYVVDTMNALLSNYISHLGMVWVRPTQPVARGYHCARDGVMLPAHVFVIRKRLLNLLLAAQRYNDEQH